MQKYTINITIITNATTEIKQINYLLQRLLINLLNCNKRIEKNIRAK